MSRAEGQRIGILINAPLRTKNNSMKTFSRKEKELIKQ
jgi:hypothetical protein